MLYMFLACVSAGLLVGVVSFLLARLMINKPLHSLIDASLALSKGKMDADFRLKEARDEFGVLNSAFLLVIKLFKS